jgi:hypothetical protein
MQTRKRAKNDATNEQASTESIDGMGGVMNEKDLEAKVMR